MTKNRDLPLTWAASIRRDFILWSLAVKGEVYREKIMAHFGISEGQATADIGMLLTERPEVMSYDKSRKRYVARRHPPAAQLAKLAEALGWD